MRRALVLLLCLWLVAPLGPLTLGITSSPAMAAHGVRRCPNRKCGKPTQPAWKFCKHCGTKLAPPKRTVLVCLQSGLRPNPHCPSTANRDFEVGKEPLAVCLDHKAVVAVEVCDQSGLRSNPRCPSTAIRNFDVGKEPAATCSDHKALLTVVVCQQSGLRPNPHCPSRAGRDFEAGREPTAVCADHKPEPPRRSLASMLEAPPTFPEVVRGADYSSIVLHGSIQGVNGQGMQFDASGTRLLLQGAIYDTETCKLAARVTGQYPYALAANGELVASLSLDNKTIDIYEIQSGRLLTSLKGLSTNAGDIHFIADDRRLVAATVGETIVWDLISSKPLKVIPGHPGRWSKVAAARNGGTLAVNSGGETTDVYDSNTFERVQTLPIWMCYSGIALDGSLFAISPYDGSPKIFRRDGTVAHDFRVSFQSKMAISPDGRTAAVSWYDRNTSSSSLELYSLESGASLRKLDARNGVVDVQFSPDGRQLAVALNAQWKDLPGGGMTALEETYEVRIYRIIG